MSDFAMTEPMHDASEQSAQHFQQPSPGTQLAMRRQQFGWTIEQVASQINLAPRQIEAIEADDFAALPGMAVARGFIRAYAKLLKIDAAPLMEQIGGLPGTAENAIPLRRTIAATSFTPHRPATRARKGGSGKLVAGLIAIALIGAGAYAFVGHTGVGASLAGKFSSHLPGSESATATQNGASAQVVEAPAAPALSQDSAQNSASSSVATPETAATTPAVTPAPLPPALMPSPSLEPRPASSAAASEKALVLKLREDSWVEIKRADNTTVVSRVMRAGSTESFDISGPVTLTVGNARGVDASLRGELLSLRSGAKNNVARIRVQ
jgi:cytoskeleton protein RodZ